MERFHCQVVPFSSEWLDTSSRNTSSQLDGHCQLHIIFSFRSGWKATVWSCSVYVFGHVLVHSCTHLCTCMCQSPLRYFPLGNNMWCSSTQLISRQGNLLWLHFEWGHTRPSRVINILFEKSVRKLRKGQNRSKEWDIQGRLSYCCISRALFINIW